MQKQQLAKAGMKPPTQRYSQLDKRSRKDKKEFMRSLALLLFALTGSVFASTIVVPPAPVPEFADTEVSTNIAVRVSDEQAQEIGMSFALYGASISNCLQVAFGRDVDGDGVLGVNESETLFGWRNGRYFAENMSGGVRVEEAASDGGTSRVFMVSFRLSKGRGLRHFTATNETGIAVFTNFSASAQGWLYSPEWNMMRVTRRGPGVPDEWFTCDIRSHAFVIRLM